MTYNDNMSADQQISTEERIAAYLFDKAGASNHQATEAGKEILKMVVAEFRPDLIATLSERIVEAVNSLPLGAIITGNKVTIADDVGKILGETVSYGQIELAVKLDKRGASVGAESPKLNESGVADDTGTITDVETWLAFST